MQNIELKFFEVRNKYLATGCNEEKATQLAWEFVQPQLREMEKKPMVKTNGIVLTGIMADAYNDMFEYYQREYEQKIDPENLDELPDSAYRAERDEWAYEMADAAYKEYLEGEEVR